MHSKAGELPGTPVRCTGLQSNRMLHSRDTAMVFLPFSSTGDINWFGNL